ncbi:MAG: EamA family transporter [Candidatus Heimdallarchaeota archaeon]|nr:EamA family transporter [Candidatus Heimdallarchaeota archaeon]
MLIPIIIALSGTCALNIGFLLQKSDASNLPSIKSSNVLQTFLLVMKCRKWLLGTILTSTGWILFLIAISLAPLSVIAPLGNAGVLVLVVFAIIYLDEKLNFYEWIGLVIIIAGVILIPLFSPPLTAETLVFDSSFIIILTLVFIMSLLIIAIIQKRIAPTKSGAFLGIASGITAGLGAVYTKVLSLVFEEIFLLLLVLTIFLIFQLISFLTLQTAFQRERATVVVPLFNSFSTLLPVIFGVLTFSESIPIGQMVGIILIVIGASALFQFSEPDIS